MIPAGKLDRRITILRGTKVKDSYNSEVLTWEPLASVWAQALPVLDAERLRAGEKLGVKSYRFSIRYSPTMATVDYRDRLSFEGRLFDINGVKEMGRREFIEITATARAEKT
jgi:SPP1 family predicted phage head-tail adaptor